MRLVVTRINLGLWAAAYVKEKIQSFSPTPQKPFVLGLPTGGTMVDMYANLRLFYREGMLDFQSVITFNMDEYVGLSPEHPQSYHSYMYHDLFSKVNIRPENIHILNGQAENLFQECLNYEKAISASGGIRLFLGGVGRNGHIAFNEPGTPFSSRTRLVNLTPQTLQANSRFFSNDVRRVPAQALTVGIGTILDAQELLFLVSGTEKAQAVSRFSLPGITTSCPLTSLKRHSHATLLADLEACSLLEGPLKRNLQEQMQKAPFEEHWVLEVEE